MTSVRISLLAPTSDGTGRRPTGTLEWRPSKRRTVGDDVVLPAPFTVGLADPPPEIEVAPTEPGWAWQVVERVQGGSPRARYVAVPDSPTVIDYADLVEVDAATLDPLPDPTNAWKSYVDARAVPTGGTTGQVLSKASDADRDTEWVDQTGGGGGGGGAVASVNGQTGAVVLDAADVGAQPAGDYATQTDLSTGLGTKVNSSTYSAGLAAKQDKATLGSDVAADATVRAAYGTVLSFTDPRVGGVGDGTTDNTGAFNTALTLLATGGGTLFFPPGIYRINGTTNDVPGGVWLVGSGYDFHTPTTVSDRPAKHSVIRAGAAMTRLIQLGSGNANSSASGATGASMRNLIVDGNNLAVTTVKTVARRNRIMECQIYSGTTNALWIAGQNNDVSGSVIAQDDTGDVVLVQGYYDNKVHHNQIRGPGTTGACIRLVDSSQNDIQHNHLWAGGNGTAAAAQGLIVLDSHQTGGVYKTMIQNNTVEGVIGPQILLNVLDTGAVIRGLSIADNRFYQPSATGMTDAGQPVIQMTNAAAGNGFISSVTVADNIIEGAASNARYKSLIAWPTNALADNTRWIIDGNVGTFVGAMQSGSPFNSIQWGFNMIQNGSTVKKSKWSDKATASGDGSTLIFSFPHTLDTTPRSVRVTPGSSGAAAAGGFYVSADATNITVTYNGTAPTTGSNNLTWRWEAEI